MRQWLDLAIYFFKEKNHFYCSILCAIDLCGCLVFFQVSYTQTCKCLFETSSKWFFLFFVIICVLHFKACNLAENWHLFSCFEGQPCQYKATTVTTKISIQVSADTSCHVYNTTFNQTGGTIIISDLTPGTTYLLTINCTTECCSNFTTRKFACCLFSFQQWLYRMVFWSMHYRTCVEIQILQGLYRWIVKDWCALWL